MATPTKPGVKGGFVPLIAPVPPQKAKPVQKPKPAEKPALPAGFEKKLFELEFSIENPKLVTQATILQLIDMYTKAAEHYDKIKDNSLSDIFRQKISLLFMKPHIMQIYQGKAVEPQNKPCNEQSTTP